MNRKKQYADMETWMSLSTSWLFAKGKMQVTLF